MASLLAAHSQQFFPANDRIIDFRTRAFFVTLAPDSDGFKGATFSCAWWGLR
jgi:hypothetical protein